VITTTSIRTKGVSKLAQQYAHGPYADTIIYKYLV